MSYYKLIAEHFGIQCTFSEGESYMECLSWSDLVIGPVFSGAMSECLIVRKPYYPVLIQPVSVNTSYLQGHQVFDSVESLRAALLSKVPLEQDAILNDFTSLLDIPDPANRTWDTVEKILNDVV